MGFDYKWDKDHNRIIVSGLSDFSLQQTLECGQCFRWNREQDGSYTGVAFSRVINIREDAGTVIIENCTLQDFLEIWKVYFDLDRDYDTIKRALSMDDPIMKRVISYGWGIRLLDQDEWETLISFIISQNANIPRIKKCIENICSQYGKPIRDHKGRTHYSFPAPGDLAKCTQNGIGTCRLGYREKYVLETAEKIARDSGRALYEVKDQSRQAAEKYLLGLCGVGAKVANCVMLFAMGKYDSFPIDVWMRRIMADLYHLNENDLAEMTGFAAVRFGALSGFAQQYLFYYARENKEKRPCLDQL